MPEWYSQTLRIFLYALYTDENIPIDPSFFFRHVKCNNVGKGIMAQICLVYGVKVLVTTEDIIDIIDPIFFIINYLNNPLPNFSLRFDLEPNVL